VQARRLADWQARKWRRKGRTSSAQENNLQCHQLNRMSSGAGLRGGEEGAAYNFGTGKWQ